MADQEIVHASFWLSEKLFEKILSKQGEAVHIKQFHIKSAFCNGENFSSQLMRVFVEYSANNAIHSEKMIIKTTLGEKMVRSRDVFAKEICIYEEIVPQIEKILESANISMKLTPK